MSLTNQEARLGLVGQLFILLLLLLLLFTVRLEQLQEKSTKENNSLGESTRLWSAPGHLSSPPLFVSSMVANFTSSSYTNDA